MEQHPWGMSITPLPASLHQGWTAEDFAGLHVPEDSDLSNTQSRTWWHGITLSPTL